MYRKPIMSPNVVTHVWYRVKLIKKGRAVEFIGFYVSIIYFVFRSVSENFFDFSDITDALQEFTPVFFIWTSKGICEVQYRKELESSSSSWRDGERLLF